MMQTATNARPARMAMRMTRTGVTTRSAWRLVSATMCSGWDSFRVKAWRVAGSLIPFTIIFYWSQVVVVV